MTTEPKIYYYVLLNKLSDKAIDVASSNTDPGSRVVIWSKNHNENQQWYDHKETGTIRTRLNGYCLELQGQMLINGHLLCMIFWRQLRRPKAEAPGAVLVGEPRSCGFGRRMGGNVLEPA